MQSSEIINKTQITEILDHPEDYIDSAVYFSWERYFTDLLEKETADNDRIRYNKTKISDYYLSDHNIKKVLDVMPDEIRSYLESSCDTPK